MQTGTVPSDFPRSQDKSKRTVTADIIHSSNRVENYLRGAVTHLQIMIFFAPVCKGINMPSLSILVKRTFHNINRSEPLKLSCVVYLPLDYLKGKGLCSGVASLALKHHLRRSPLCIIAVGDDLKIRTGYEVFGS